jgi:hypothetical protein
MDNDTANSLRRINISLREKSPTKKIKNKIVFRIWTKRRDFMEFSSESSTLNFFNNKWPKNRCPYCESNYGSKDMTDKTDQSWKFKCPRCKSILIVLNE